MGGPQSAKRRVGELRRKSGADGYGQGEGTRRGGGVPLDAGGFTKNNRATQDNGLSREVFLDLARNL